MLFCPKNPLKIPHRQKWGKFRVCLSVTAICYTTKTPHVSTPPKKLPIIPSIIRGLINMRPMQLREDEMLRRMSIIGLELIPTFVSILNSTVFLF
jgi:hypothetical protein